RYMSEMKTAESTRASYCFPLYVSDEVDGLDFAKYKVAPNLSPGFTAGLSKQLSLAPEDLSPQLIFDYVYAVLYSPSYRTKYAASLRIDFPRIPLPSNSRLFDDL